MLGSLAFLQVLFWLGGFDSGSEGLTAALKISDESEIACAPPGVYRVEAESRMSGAPLKF